jgi:hypothetical protein
MKNYFILILLLLFIHCKDNKETVKVEQPKHIVDVPVDEKTFKSPKQNVKYEYRTGNSGNYNYNYDVEGEDQNGNYVSGNVEISSNGGDGYINDDEGNEIYIEVEWVGYGQIEGTDENGNNYDLSIN